MERRPHLLTVELDHEKQHLIITALAIKEYVSSTLSRDDNRRPKVISRQLLETYKAKTKRMIFLGKGTNYRDPVQRKQYLFPLADNPELAPLFEKGEED